MIYRMQIFFLQYKTIRNWRGSERAKRSLVYELKFSNVCNLGLGHRFDDLVEADTAEKMKF